jgi:hypothetical protein
MVNSAVNHALINHSNVLSNTVHNVVVQTFKEGQVPPHYVGPAYHQPELASVNAPSAPSAVVGTEVTSPPALAGLPNVQSTPIRSDPVLSGGRVQLNTIQGLCLKTARFLLIGEDMVCLRSCLPSTLVYLKCLT